jgi:small subunit ribosomal protein S1
MEEQNALVGQEVEPAGLETGQIPAEAAPAPESSSMESLLEEQGLSLDFPTQGEIRQGVIATLRENEILVSIGTKSEGVISGRELESISSEERAVFQVGQKIPVFVVSPEDQNGNVVLSYIRAREEKDWEDVQQLLENNAAYDSRVIGYNKGGLIVPVGNLRGFVPASQISLSRRSSSSGVNESPEQRWAKMVGDEIKVRVIEVDRERRRLILSERMALQETRESLKDRLLDELQEGTVRSGRVTSLAEFGAFVNIDGADGLVHLSEISWERIQHPNEVLKVGQEVEVKVISVDRERKRIGLSIRQLQADPWTQKTAYLKEGMLVEGTITHLTKFGAFARLDDDLEGLIHLSELSENRINHPKEVVREGEVVTLRVIKIDPERRRIGLSLRKVDSPAYADLDWKMELAEEVEKVSSSESGPEEVEVASSSESEPDEVEVASLSESEPEAVSPVAEAEGQSGNLEYIQGIGPAYAAKLNEIGVFTTGQLLETGSTPKGREELAEKSGISEKLILTWVNHCDLFRINGVGAQYAELLEAAGVDTVVELAQRNPENLAAKLAEVNAEKNLVNRLPDEGSVQDWIEQAKGLPRAISY